MTVSINGISIDEFDWKREDKRLESNHRTRSGKQFRYKWGEFERVAFAVDQVNSATAAQINSLWITGSVCVVTRYSDVISGYIVNAQSPFNKVTDARYDLWQGRIELESF